MASVHNIESLSNYFIKTAGNICLHFGDKEEREKYLKELYDCVYNSCVHEKKLRKSQKTLRDLLNDGNEELTEQQIMDLYNTKKNEMMSYNPNVSDHQVLKEYLRNVQGMVSNLEGSQNDSQNDDDLAFTESQINVIDPFTKVRMTDPVKNKKCGHIYDGESVKLILQKNPHTRCPVVGCSNKTYIALEDMVPDVITKRYLHENP